MTESTPTTLRAGDPMTDPRAFLSMTATDDRASPAAEDGPATPDLESVLAALDAAELRRSDHDGQGRWHCPACRAPMRISEADDGAPVPSCVRRCSAPRIMEALGFSDMAKAARRQAAIEAELDRRYAVAVIELQFLHWLRERGSSTP